MIGLMEDLPPELFDRWAAHRPCGKLCKLGAAGMLICDVLGLPLVPWELAEPIGKAASKLVAKIPGAQSTAKKAAARKGRSRPDICSTPEDTADKSQCMGCRHDRRGPRSP